MPNITGATQFFPKAAESSVPLSLGASVAASATTVQVTNLNTNYSNGDTVVLTIDPGTPATKQVFTGQVSTGSVLNVIWTEGTNQPHTVGAIIIDYTSATHQNLMQKGISVQHNQDGTHAASVITGANIAANTIGAGNIAANTIGAGQIANNSITTTQLAATTIASSNMNLGHVVDGLGWRVHDYGTFKEYLYSPATFSPVTYGAWGASFCSQTVANNIPLPAGISASGNLSFQVYGTGTANGSVSNPITYQLQINGTGASFDGGPGGSLAIIANNPTNQAVAGFYTTVWIRATDRT